MPFAGGVLALARAGVVSEYGTAPRRAACARTPSANRQRRRLRPGRTSGRALHNTTHTGKLKNSEPLEY